MALTLQAVNIASIVEREAVIDEERPLIAAVYINRFLQPDIDIETLRIDTGFELSTPHEGRLPRTWIAALRNHTMASLAGSTGVEEAVLWAMRCAFSELSAA